MPQPPSLPMGCCMVHAGGWRTNGDVLTHIFFILHALPWMRNAVQIASEHESGQLAMLPSDELSGSDPNGFAQLGQIM